MTPMVSKVLSVRWLRKEKAPETGVEVDADVDVDVEEEGGVARELRARLERTDLAYFINSCRYPFSMSGLVRTLARQTLAASLVGPLSPR